MMNVVLILSSVLHIWVGNVCKNTKTHFKMNWRWYENLKYTCMNCLASRYLHTKTIFYSSESDSYEQVILHIIAYAKTGICCDKSVFLHSDNRSIIGGLN